MENMRAEWADMFSIIGRGIKRGEKKGLFEKKQLMRSLNSKNSLEINLKII